MAAAGRKPSDAAAVWDDASQDRRPNGSDGLAEGCWYTASRKKEARNGGVYMELSEKMGLVGFDVLGQGESGAWRVRRRLPAKKMRLTG